MALINCPSCNKKMSDKAKACPHCGFAINDASEEDILRKQQMQLFKKKQSIQNQSMLAMLMFVAGFGMWFWGGPDPSDLQQNASVGCSVIGFIWYLINRVRLIIVKRFS